MSKAAFSSVGCIHFSMDVTGHLTDSFKSVLLLNLGMLSRMGRIFVKLYKYIVNDSACLLCCKRTNTQTLNTLIKRLLILGESDSCKLTKMPRSS